MTLPAELDAAFKATLARFSAIADRMEKRDAEMQRNSLKTAAEIAKELGVSTKTILRWKCDGKITAEIDSGHTVLFNSERVAKQLAKTSRKPVKGVAMLPVI